MARPFLLPILGFLLLLSPAALGQPRDRSAADRLFKEGRAAFDKEDYAVACPRFAESYKAEPAPGTLLNLAVCEEKIGKVASARQHLSELMPQLAVKDDRIPFAQDLLAKVNARVARLSFTISAGAPPETQVVLAGEGERKAMPFGVETLLDPGEYQLLITAPGRPSSQIKIKLAEGQREARAIAPAEAEKIAVTPVVKPPPSSLSLRRTLGIVSGGIGVASLGVAAVTGVLLLGKKSKVDEHCPAKRCDEIGIGLKTEAEGTKLLPVNTATWIIGIAGVGAGAALILTSLGKDTDAAGPKVTAFPAVLPGGGGLGVVGRF